MNAPEPRPDPGWETELSRQLKQLPDRRAPATLVPRVMAAVQARARQPWYRRTWWHWPPAAQVLSLTLASSLLGGLTWLALHADHGGLAGAAAARITTCLAPLAPLWSFISSLGRVLALLLGQATPLTWFIAGALLVTTYLLCIALGTVLFRLSAIRSNP